MSLQEAHNKLVTKFSGDLWPEILSSTIEDEQANLSLSLTPKLSYFAGHFPEKPVLPGIVQIHWASMFAKELFAAEGFSSMQKIKFVELAVPGKKVKLKLAYDYVSSRLKFEYSVEAENMRATEESISSGLILFSSKPEKRGHNSAAIGTEAVK